jgi:hypothetical protein
MGFASGFRTGLLTGGGPRSAMPIVQGLGSMIDRLQARSKRGGSVRYAGKGESSYDKYTKRKQQEEAAAEEKRRYEAEQRAGQEREQMASNLATQQAEEKAAQAAVVEERTAETHASKMATEKQEREKAAAMFKRSKKKEDRIEAFRGILQGAAAGNKALVEESWAALAPDMPEGDKEQADWQAIKEEPYIDPETGQPAVDPETGKPVRKFTVGRDKDGNESKKAMPAPAVDFNEDGSITVEYPGSEGEVTTYADMEQFKQAISVLNPEYESDKSLKAAEGRKKSKRAEEKHELAKIKAEQDRINDMIKAEGDPDEIAEYQAKLDKRRQAITGGLEGGAAAGKTKMMSFKEGQMEVEADKDKKPKAVKGAVKVSWSDEHEAWLAYNKKGDQFFIPAKK